MRRDLLQFDIYNYTDKNYSKPETEYIKKKVQNYNLKTHQNI